MHASCLLKGHSLLNTPISARDTGAILGYAQDIIFDYDQNQVLAFLVDPRWRVESRVLPWGGIYAVQVDGIISHNAAMLTEGMNLLAVRRVFERDNVRRGTRLLLADGRSLGRVEDIYFDGHGVIAGYATVSAAGSTQPVRRFVPAPRFLQIDSDHAVVTDETGQAMEERALARRRLPNAMHLLAASLWRRPREAAVGEAELDATIQSLTDELARAGVHLAEGCRAQTTVLNEAGRIVAIGGAIVDERSIERARACHRERALLSAVGADPLGAVLATMPDHGARA